MRSKTQPHIPKSVVLHQISQQTLSGIYKLIPKHLDIKVKKSVSGKQLEYKQSISEKVAKQKMKFTKPLKDVELLMKKFDEVSQSKKLVGQTPRQTILKERQKSQSDLDKRIKGILALPTIKNIKQKVNQQKYRNAMEPQTATLAILVEASRQSLLRKYDEYIKMAIKPVHKKAKTEHNQ